MPKETAVQPKLRVITVRMSEDLHKKIASEARRIGTSINKLCTEKLTLSEEFWNSLLAIDWTKLQTDHATHVEGYDYKVIGTELKSLLEKREEDAKRKEAFNRRRKAKVNEQEKT